MSERLTYDDLTALNDGLIGAVYIESKQVRMDTEHATSLIAMARDSLDLRAQLAAMTAERDHWHEGWKRAMGEFDLKCKALNAALAERDALVGAVMISFAEKCERAANAEVGHERQYLISHAAWFRALTPADATTALNHMLAQAKAEGRKEGMRKAAELMTLWIGYTRIGPADYIRGQEDTALFSRAAILAAAEKEPRHD